jgi:hypothetical protein
LVVSEDDDGPYEEPLRPLESGANSPRIDQHIVDSILKHTKSSDTPMGPVSLDVVGAALAKYATFHDKCVEEVSLKEVCRSSAGIVGWAQANICPDLAVILEATFVADGRVEIGCISLAGDTLARLVVDAVVPLSDVKAELAALLSVCLPSSTFPCSRQLRLLTAGGGILTDRLLGELAAASLV